MIQCDNCKEWYHGDCVNQKESEADDIINYYCMECRKLNPRKFRIRYKASKKSQLIKLETPTDLDKHNICYGIGCLKQRDKESGSKYCSVKCGQVLARARVEALLPQIHAKIKSHIAPKLKNSQNQLFKIVKEQKELENELLFVNLKIEALKKICQRSEKFRKEAEEKNQIKNENLEKSKRSKNKGTHAILDDSSDEENEDKETNNDDGNIENQQIFCPICGNNTNSAIYLKHLDVCYRRKENALSYDSAQITKNGTACDNLFCDEYDIRERQRKYCKRLKISCPEHTKKLKISESDVCGYPMDDSVAQLGRLDQLRCQSNEPKEFLFHHSNFDPLNAEVGRKSPFEDLEPMVPAKKRKIYENQDNDIDFYIPAQISLPLSPHDDCRTEALKLKNRDEIKSNQKTRSYSPTEFSDSDDDNSENEKQTEKDKVENKTTDHNLEQLLKQQQGQLRFCSLLRKNCNKHYNWDIVLKSALDIRRMEIFVNLERLSRQEDRCNLSTLSKYDLVDLLRHETVRE